MSRPAVTGSGISAATGGPGGVRVDDVVLLGIRVSAHAAVDFGEHRRRKAAGTGAVADPALLNRLLGLPLGVPLRDLALWGEMAGQAPGIVSRSDDSLTVTRMLRPPLAITDVVVGSAVGREVSTVQQASWFAGFTRRWIVAARDTLPDAVLLEAKVCGVGVLGPGHQVFLRAEPPTASLIDKWSWLLQEKVYQRWLSQLSQEHEMGSPPRSTAESSSTRGS